MTFKGCEHLKNIKEINELWEKVNELSKFADKFGIDDIFQDNEGKVLQQLVYMNFSNLEGREGNDGKDGNGVEWEMKSININKTTLVSTHHHLNVKILKKYRLVPWSFAAYKGTELQYIYAISPDKLSELYFDEWEENIVSKNRELNNPKIDLNYIKKAGELIYSKESGIVKDPKTIYSEELMLKNLEYDFCTSDKRDLEEILNELKEFIETLDEDIKIKKAKDNEEEFCVRDVPFLKVKKNKNDLRIFLVGIEPDSSRSLDEIKGGKLINKAYSSRYKQQGKREELQSLKALIEESYLNSN